MQFYDQLAGDYHLIFADWHKAIKWQGDVLGGIIRRRVDGAPISVLDCSCGIGTQAIGLAERGYRVHATDISPVAVERARREAAAAGVAITFGVADLCTLDRQVNGVFDVAISCDNALPHLLSREDLRLAVHNMRAKLRDRGLFLASVRDYDALMVERPRSTAPRVFDDADGRRVVFQVWDWPDNGPTYTVTQFILHERQGGWVTNSYATRYRALPRRELDEILDDEGFTDVTWLMPDESGYYQPIVTAHRR
jgi:glycine/sarcosine N-methyltransferase